MASGYTYGRGGDGLRDRQSLFGTGPSTSGAGAGAGNTGDIQLTISPGFDLDNEVDGLRGKVTRMKGLALDIQTESRLNSDLLNNLEETFSKARMSLKKNMKRIDRAFKFTGSSHILLLLVFAIGVMMMFYIWTKVYAWGKFFGKISGLAS